MTSAKDGQPPLLGWSPIIQNLLRILPIDLTHKIKTKVTTAIDGQPLSPGWLATITRMVTHHQKSTTDLEFGT